MISIKTLSALFILSLSLTACEKNTNNDPTNNTATQLDFQPDPQKTTPHNTQVQAIENFLSESPHSAQKNSQEKLQKNHPKNRQTNPFNNTLSGEVIEIVNASSFTFIKIKTPNQTLWAAGPVTSIKSGDQISIDGKTPMENFFSKSLNRTFDIIYFVNTFTINGQVVTSSFAE